MSENNLPLSSQFKIEVLRRYVKKNPEKALELVLKYYQECYELSQQNKSLQQTYLESRNDLFM